MIKGERKGALYGSIFTVLLALIFTCFQGVEYSVSSFTISDGAFGTCFFFGTGFHGFSYNSNNVNCYSPIFYCFFCFFFSNPSDWKKKNQKKNSKVQKISAGYFIWGSACFAANLLPDMHTS